MKRDLFCRRCDREEYDVYLEGLDYPRCPCGNRMETLFRCSPAMDIYGGPQYHPALDITFASKSEMRAYLKSKGLMECGDPVHGARNEDGLRLGKLYSYAGQATRSSRDYAEPKSHRTIIKNGRVERG